MGNRNVKEVVQKVLVRLANEAKAKKAITVPVGPCYIQKAVEDAKPEWKGQTNTAQFTMYAPRFMSLADWAESDDIGVHVTRLGGRQSESMEDFMAALLK